MKQKIFSLLLLLLSAISGNSQENISFITPQQLYDQVRQRARPAIVQFWIPNCAAAPATVQTYDSLQKTAGESVDFYFIGVTNKKALVQNLIRQSGFADTLYIADTIVAPDINQRMKTFSRAFIRLAGRERKRFLTAYYFPEKGRFIFTGRTNIRLQRLQR